MSSPRHWCARPRCERRSASRPTIRTAHRRRGHRRRARRGPIHGRYRSVDRRRRCARARSLGRLEPRLSAGSDRATLAAEVAEARAAADAARAEAGASRTAAGGTRGPGPPRRGRAPGRRPSPTRDCGRPRPGWRSATRRCGTGGGAAAGNAFVLRAPIAGRVAEVCATLGASYDEGAPLFRIVRTDRSGVAGAQVPAADARVARDVASARVRDSRAVPIRFALRAASHARRRRHRRRRRARCRCRFEVDNPRRTAADRPDRHGHAVHAQRRAGAGRAQGGGADGSRPTVRLRPASAASASRGGSSRSPRATATWSASRAASKPGDRVVTRGAYDVQLASAAKGLPAEGHVH